MKLEPAVRAHVDAAGSAPARGAGIAAIREWLQHEIDRIFTLFALPGPPVRTINDHEVPVPGGVILLRSYHPVDSAALPAHIILHGGGWSTGSVHELVADATARHRAVGANCVALSLEYRLAPESPFPAAIDDVVAAVHWVRDHADRIGVYPDVITVGGASAGANLAAAAVIADPTLDVTALLLEVAVLDLRPTAITTEISLEDGYGEWVERSQEALDHAIGLYLGDRTSAASPLASPLLAPDLSIFPETHLLTAEFDLVRASAELFAQRLSEANVPVGIKCYPGALHGSPILTASWPTAREWQDDIVAILVDVHRRALAPGALPQ